MCDKINVIEDRVDNAAGQLEMLESKQASKMNMNEDV